MREGRIAVVSRAGPGAAGGVWASGAARPVRGRVGPVRWSATREAGRSKDEVARARDLARRRGGVDRYLQSSVAVPGRQDSSSVPCPNHARVLFARLGSAFGPYWA